MICEKLLNFAAIKEKTIRPINNSNKHRRIMAEAEDNIQQTAIPTRKPRITLRVGQGSLSFSTAEGRNNSEVCYEAYDMNGSISQAANLREAFKRSTMLGETTPDDRALVAVDTPVMVVPVEEFSAEQVTTLYHHTFSGGLDGQSVMWSVIPQLNAVAVFTVNKDLKMVIDDHFDDVKWSHVCIPVWTHLYHRSFTGTHRKMYAFFHERRVDLLSFQQNRFRFVNSFDANHRADVVYFILNVWKNLGLDQRHDDIFLCGDIPERDQLQSELHQYVQNVYAINPTADFNRSAASKVEGMPYDLVALYSKG